jgi:twin BRCT domain
MKVAITGTLAMPRKEAVQLLESRTGATFSEHVTYDTNYLIAARFDTNKARRAAALGVTVISESDFLSFVEQGAFPANRLPERPKQPHENHFPEITWTDVFDPEPTVLMTYRDADGVESQRFVTLTCKGSGSNGVEYIGGYDAERFKTFRIDRVVAIEHLTEASAAIKTVFSNSAN